MTSMRGLINQSHPNLSIFRINLTLYFYPKCIAASLLLLKVRRELAGLPTSYSRQPTPQESLFALTEEFLAAVVPPPRRTQEERLGYHIS